MQHKKFFKTISISLGLCGGIIVAPVLASCSTQQVRQPSIKQSINLNIKFSDLLTTANNAPTNKEKAISLRSTNEVLKTPKQLFDDEFKKYPEKFIDNYDVLSQEQIHNLKIETTAKETNENFNSGNMTYEQWSKPITSPSPIGKSMTNTSIQKVYYPNDGSFITVSSPKELHDKLTSQIQEIFEKIQGKPEDNKTVTYKLNESSKIGYTKNDDLLHVNVTKTETTPQEQKDSVSKQTAETQYDLCIPVSSIFYFVKTDTIKISSTKGDTTLLDLSKGTTYLNFDIGIQGQAMSEKFTKENLMIGTTKQSATTKTEINVNTVLTALGWVKKNEPTNTGDFVLDQQKISQDLNVFNVSFSEPKLFKIDNAVKTNTTYHVGLTASPTVNHSWAIDGSVGKKLITTGDIKVMKQEGTTDKTDNIIFDLGSQSETLVPKIISELSKINSKTAKQSLNMTQTMIETEVKKIVGNSNVTVKVNLKDFGDGKTMQEANLDITLNNVSIIGNSSLLKLKANNIITLANSVTTKLVSSGPSETKKN